MKGNIDMTQVQKALILASAMLGVALLAVNDILPGQFAEFSPLALLVFLPWVLNSKGQAKTGGACK